MIADALKFSNDVRAKLGLEPLPALLPGQSASLGRCPVANTIKAGSNLADIEVTEFEVEVYFDQFRGERKIFEVTPEARAFIEAFDKDQYPELKESNV